MQLLYDMPIPLGEPHYAQIIKADKVDAIEVYKPIGIERDHARGRPPHGEGSGEERIERKADGVHVYMTAVRSHFKPDIVRVKEGDTVHVAHHERRAGQGRHPRVRDRLPQREREPRTGRSTRTSPWWRRSAGVFPLYCTEFCSALHLEMAGYMLVEPEVSRARGAAGAGSAVAARPRGWRRPSRPPLLRRPRARGTASRDRAGERTCAEAVASAAPEGQRASASSAGGLHRGTGEAGAVRASWSGGSRDAVITLRRAGAAPSPWREPGAALLGVTVDGSGGPLRPARRGGPRAPQTTSGWRACSVRQRPLRPAGREARADVVLRGNRGRGRARDQRPGPARRRHPHLGGARLDGWRATTCATAATWWCGTRPATGSSATGSKRGRYGTHFMYSHDNVVEGNHYRRATWSAIFIMYSRGVARCGDNVLAAAPRARPASASARRTRATSRSRNNLVRRATQVGGLPRHEPALAGRPATTSSRATASASPAPPVLFHGGADRNRLRRQRASGDNQVHGAPWKAAATPQDARVAPGNHFDDYAGYDLDGDGSRRPPLRAAEPVGARARAAREPALAFFRGSPAMGLVELVGEALPLFRPTTLMVPIFGDADDAAGAHGRPHAAHDAAGAARAAAELPRAH